MKFKKIISGMISLSMISAAFTMPALAADNSGQTSAPADYLINLTFDEEGTGTGSYSASTGGTVLENGTVSYSEGKEGLALDIAAKAPENYLTLPDGILEGKSAATYSFWLKPASDSTPNWPFMTTSEDTHTVGWEKYVGMLATTSAYTVERYNNSGERISSVTSSGAYNDWKYVTVVIEETGTKLYINGILAVSDSKTVDIGELFTPTSKTWLGHANWGDGEGFMGMIDEFKLYGRALSEVEIISLAGDAYTSELEANKYAKIYENNCYVIDTHFYDNDNAEIFAYNGSGDVTITANIENDTALTGEAAVSVYADDSQEPLAKSGAVSLVSLENKDVKLTIPEADIPQDTAKLDVKVDIGDEEIYTAAALYCGIQGPVAAPPDSDATTNGAHDPSIVQFPGDDTFYVYSSHHLIFTSTDLINWKKYDFTNINANTISPITSAFISKNYTNTTMNDTYWAPDVIYKEGDKHPYWMYISLSCGLGGMNSAISLMKSDKPLFWADSSADIIDAGVVFATKNGSGKTNSIDANIYTDPYDGKQYFIWGSFWGGIQAAPLQADGFVEGVDYTSDATLLSSCKSLGTTVYSQKSGVAGPEGAWMINCGSYRYMFTSYGWLGSNYNTRIARSPLSAGFGTDMGTQLVDANGYQMGGQYSSGSLSSPSGYKLIGSYRLGDGSMTVTNDGSNYYVPREADDAHIYYGPGHNSVINVGDETFYCSHIRKDAVDIAATLQIRKLLFTADGWPVVSPVSYAGETEQALPEEMLYGTYDLASVGRTKMDGSTIISDTSNSLCNRNYDLPVLSSKITLKADGTLADDLGSWTFDGDHTITLTFAKDGDTSKDEFYKSGDVMTLFALYGYDKDETEPVIALTGVDQNHITQLAKKIVTSTYKTPAETIAEPDAISIAKSAGGNPELGFDADGNILYAGDPAATVIGDTVYLIVGHDTAEDESYKMPEWVLYTSKNMTDWEYKGAIMQASDISWRNDNTSAWASQMVEYNGKYYFYYCTWDKTSSGKQSIGVAVADNPEGPYKDIGQPLVKGDFTTPESSSWNDIDPTVLIDTDDNGVEHRYLAWGNGKYYICELNEDMTSIKDIDGDGEIVMNLDVKERKIKGMNGGVYTEAPWLYKRDGKYYLFYAINWREEMAYAMADDPMGRYDFKQIIMPPTATSNTNHPSVIDFNGKTYFIYHNGALPRGSGFRRSVCIDELHFDENGYVYPVTETSIGLTGTASTIITSDNKYAGHNAFTNSLSDASYPLSASLAVMSAENGYNTAWELMEPKYVPSDGDAANYVSIQSVNKPGLYIASTGSGIKLTQDNDGQQGETMTFKTVKGLNGKDGTVSFVSVSDPGKYLTVLGDTLTLSYGTVPEKSSFTIGEASQQDAETIKIADIEPEPEPEDDIAQTFDDAPTGTIISLATSDTPAYTALDGVTLYIGTRSGGADSSQNFSIASVGVTGNALVLNAGKFQSASRGPRMAINTPAIPNGYTAAAEIQVKQGAAGSLLRYNDSTSDETGTEISGLTTEWQTLKITITNDNDTYIRKISLGNNVIAEDYIDSFPVLWGTTENGTGQSIYFDNLSITTINTTVGLAVDKFNVESDGSATARLTNNTEAAVNALLIAAAYDTDGVLISVKMNSADAAPGSIIELATDALNAASKNIKAFIWDASNDKPLAEYTEPVKLPDATAEYHFNGSLTDSVSGIAAALTGSKAGETTTAEAVYVDGENNDKAISFSGEGSYGVNLGKLITESKYSVSFSFKAEAITAFTAPLFIDVDGGSKWVSAPFGWKDDGTMMVWSNDGTNYIDLVSSAAVNTGEWHRVTITANGGTAVLYIDGVNLGSGSISDTITADANTYLGVNYWDTPFNGAIDDLYVYNGTALTAAQVKLIGAEISE